ncbi:hypothetical protein GCM10011507_31410 [Edaphobacter acidisoli]|uniref:Ice-binding protein C-terminal domain-containing protein n=1 Tax=Edaphobacter acidisoli TaxID=2040573 RepID=A0A916S1W3_9BACT|nr:PEP-CTERM sorting domain-containing protein [Edaphobacter acidisoli]GGA77875.1 hypothetical protein GCM10011507_31410 [Edaphobacter acidisoli]
MTIQRRWLHGRFLRTLLQIICVGVFAAWAGASALADSVVVDYGATQIGGTEWQYTYQLSGTFQSGDDLAIYFPLATSANLVDMGTGGPDWTTFVLQPDGSLPADGEFDMLANQDNPDLSSVFTVDFEWLGSGSPGSQSFTLYDPNFNVIDTGATVPEPGSLLLLGSGFLGLWALIYLRRVRVQFERAEPPASLEIPE